MKNLSFMIVAATGLLATTIFTVVSCSKKSAKTTDKKVSSNQSVQLKTTAPILLGELQLRRGRGVKKKGPNKGTDCDCNYCFGICSNGLASYELVENFFSAANLVVEDLGNGTAKLYFLVQPEEDHTIDTTLYVDDNIKYTYGSNSSVILASAYPFNPTGGTVTIGNVTVTHYGTAIVSITP